MKYVLYVFMWRYVCAWLCNLINYLAAKRGYSQNTINNIWADLFRGIAGNVYVFTKNQIRCAIVLL